MSLNYNENIVLFVDRDRETASALCSTLEETFAPLSVFCIDNRDELQKHLRTPAPQVVFVDVTFDATAPETTLLKSLIAQPDIVTIPMLPEDASRELTMQICDLNPFFFIRKPCQIEEVSFILKRAVERATSLYREKQPASPVSSYSGIIGRSPVMRQLFDLISRVAEDDIATVLIRGESGTGKELVAKAIHTQSPRSRKNFVPVNCAAIPDDLLESELFGYVKGAFTGATQAKQGRIQYADGGTLFLDEIGDMKPNLQAKLLRILQEKEFEPVGGLQPIPVNTRILAATHCNLEQLVREGRFREDLYYRLSVIPLNIPPLRERREDIPLLCQSFITTFTTTRGRNPFSFTEAAMRSLLLYRWKGNVRELENLIQHMSVLFSGKTVTDEDLPDKFAAEENQLDGEIPSFPADEEMPVTVSTETRAEEKAVFNFDEEIDFNELINEFETKLILGALKHTEGNKKEAARILKLKRTTLLEKIKKKNLNIPGS